MYDEKGFVMFSEHPDVEMTEIESRDIDILEMIFGAL